MLLTPALEFTLLLLNGAALVIALSVLILALWQDPGTPLGGALVRFMGSLVFLNATVAGTFISLLIYGEAAILARLFNTLSLTAFGLSALMAFGLIVHAAGEMKGALQVISRAGVVGLVLMQWPLWNGELFTEAPSVTQMLYTYKPAGIFAALITGFYVVFGIVLAWAWRRRINQPTLIIGLTVLLIGNGLTLILPAFRQIALPSLLSSVVGTVIGYLLVQMQFFSPLQMRIIQLDAVTTLARAMGERARLQDVLDMVVEQAQVAIRADVAILWLVDSDYKLVAAAQRGEPNMRGRILYSGQGLAGRVLQMHTTMEIANYRTWDGRAEQLNDMPFYASLSVPMLDGDDIVGVMNVHQTSAGRVYNEHDRRIVEMLAALAALSVAHRKQQQVLNMLRVKISGEDKRRTSSLHFDENGTLIMDDIGN
jgi:putative methionine-R-sulfoxide reductase with GAF domain